MPPCHDSFKLGVGDGILRRPAIFLELSHEVFLLGGLIVSWNLEHDLVEFEEGERQEDELKSSNCLLICESQKQWFRPVVFTHQKAQA